MRIWHQGFVDFDMVPVYRRSFEAHVAEIIGEDTTVRLHGLRKGTFGTDFTPIDALRHPYLETVLNTQICESVLEAERQGYDAVAVNCFYDPALREARSLVDIPVVSLFESCALVACSLGRRFGLVALNEDQQAKHAELAEAYGLKGRLAATVAMNPPIDEYVLEGDEEGTRAITEGFLRSCSRLQEAGAEVIIPGDGVMNEFVHRRRISLPGATLLDAVGILFGHAEMMANIHKRLGVTVSRHRHYARPRSAILGYARNFAGLRPIEESAFSGVGDVRHALANRR
jgi:allantoin racemase